MPGGADDGETAGSLHLGAELDIGTTARHVGGDGDLPALARLGHDFRFPRVLLRIQHVRMQAAEAHHTGQQFGGFHIRRTHEDRTACVGEFHHAVDDGVELALLGLVDDVILVVADHRTVRRDGDDIKFVDAPELARLGLGGTGHTGELVVHPEVVLQGDGRKRLGSSLHLHIFLRLHGLVQAVAPAASLHDTAGTLVHDLDLVVHDHVVDVLGEHRIGLEKLDDGMDAFALEGEVLHEGVLLLRLLGRREGGVVLDLRDGGTHVRKDEEIRVGDGVREDFVALVGHVHAVLDLGDDEIEFVRHLRHLALVVLHVVGLRLLQELLHARLGEELDERLILGKTLVASEEEFSALRLVAGRDGLLGLVQGRVDEGALLVVEVLHIRAVLHELLVVGGLLHRTGDDERGTGVIDEDGVHLVHDGVVVLPLHEVRHPRGHVVTQVVEAELVVRTEGDVAVIGALALVGIGLVLVDAVHAEAVELVQRAHPLGVTLTQVIVHGDHVHALAGERVQEHRQRRDEGLALTGRHLGDAAPLLLVGLEGSVQDDAADELHIVMDHVPGDFVAAGEPVVLPDGLVPFDMHEVAALRGEFLIELRSGHFDQFALLETAGGGFHDGESLGQDLVQDLLDGVVLVLDEFVGFGRQGLLLGDGNVLREFILNLRNTLLERLFHRENAGAEGRGTGPELIVGKRVDRRIRREDLVQYRLYELHVPVGLGAENLLEYISQCHSLQT